MILLTGGTGQLGRSIMALRDAGQFALVAPTRAELDLSNEKSVSDYLAQNRFDAVINAGAYTAVDQAETEEAQALLINARAPALLGAYCKKLDIPLIHISTDYVFSGAKSGFYTEQDASGPLGVYGKTKLAGEEAVLQSNCRAVILRTAWVVSPYGKNFIKTMLRLAADRDEISVVADQWGCPTCAGDLAKVVLAILQRLLCGQTSDQKIYHCSNQGETTWAGLARYVMTVSQKLGGPFAPIIDISTADYPTKALRPKNSRLNCAKLKSDWHIEMQPWEVAVAEIVKILLQEKGYAS